MNLQKPSVWHFLIIPVLFSLQSCRLYKQDIMFRLDDNFTAEDLTVPVSQAEHNYHLQADDYIKVDVFTNKGERIIDPNYELVAGISGQSANLRKDYEYLIQLDGQVKLPMIDKIQVAGFTVNEAELILQQAYDVHYKDCFVKITLANRRVIVLGANGGMVVPLANENMTLLEVLALYGGLELGAKATNIKLIRGDLDKPEVYQIDLSTVTGMRSSIVEVEAGDVIYVEPWRRPLIQGLKDISPLLTFTSTLLTILVVIQNL